VVRRHETDLAALGAELDRELAACRLCPHRCGVDRRVTTGRCGLGADAHVYKDLLHVGEERALIPSYAVFLSGCSLRCVYCSEGDVVLEPDVGPRLAEYPGSERVEAMRRAGARTFQFVGGEPVVNLPALVRFLQARATALGELPLVVNTNLWAEPVALDALARTADLVLADLKFGGHACALRLGGVTPYVDVLLGNLEALHARGVPLLVRHLAVPGHLDCCTRPALAALERWPDVTVNVMTGYVPIGRAAHGGGPEAHHPGRRERRELAARLRSWRSGRLLIDGES
jgi:putative pyruvate formate lyase activating enzyme